MSDSINLSDVAKEVFTYTNLVHAFSGACGGVSAISLFFPLNVARLRLQSTCSRAEPSVIRARARGAQWWW